jgi:Cu/Ag efflux pump CusA
VINDLASVAVSLRVADGDVEDGLEWPSVGLETLRSAAPWRTFRWHHGQQHFPGSYWAVTNCDLVIYESRLELARLLYADFDPAVEWIVAQPFLLMLTLPMALIGGALTIYFARRDVSIGALVGFFTVFGIAARNGILLINHCQHLEEFEGETFGPALVLRGARERLSPILMTSLATGLALVPLVIRGDAPGQEIEYPLAVVILGGLVSSTLLTLFVVPSLYLRFGKRSRGPQVSPANTAEPA